MRIIIQIIERRNNRIGRRGREGDTRGRVAVTHVRMHVRTSSSSSASECMVLVASGITPNRGFSEGGMKRSSRRSKRR